jgi:TatD DNase family protein
VRAAVGIHPNFAGESRPEDFATVAELSRAPEVIAIGETGLDYYRQHTSPDGQRRAFTWHLALAEDRHLPVIVHNRQADADVVRLTGDHHVSGVLHCFTSTDARYLEHMLARGYYVSFAGPLTFKNASETRAMAAIVPPDRLLVETDCPYLAPVPNRGRRNEPAFVRHTAACLADTLGVSFDTMVDTLWTNTRNAFPILARDQVAA